MQRLQGRQHAAPSRQATPGCRGSSSCYRYRRAKPATSSLPAAAVARHGWPAVAAAPAAARCAAAAATDPVAAAGAAAPPPPPAPGAASANGQPMSHDRLLDLGASFVRAWFSGIAKGAQAVEQELGAILADDVRVMADDVRQLRDTQGLTHVLAELERAHLEYHRSEHRPMLYAASHESQRVYALVEGRYQDVGALPGHPATFRISKVHHILALEVAGGRVVRLWLRRQLTEEDKDDLLRDPLACYPSAFPRDCMRLADAATHDQAAPQMVAAVRAWWGAWGAPRAPPAEPQGAGAGRRAQPDPSAVAARVLSPDFRMWDAHGLWPSMRAQGRRHLSRDAALHWLSGLRYSHDVSLHVADVAVAEGSLACFTHWQARLTPRWPAAPGEQQQQQQPQTQPQPQPAGEQQRQGATEQQQQQQQQQQEEEQGGAGGFTVEGMEVDLFDDELRLHDIWVFRGPMGAKDAGLFLGHGKKELAASEAAAASAQEEIRQQRREQREQQLRELLAWMRQYQEQWGAYVAHVQKQLARSQVVARAELAKQQGIVLDSLQQHLAQQRQQLLQQEQAAAAAAATAAAAEAAEAQRQGPQEPPAGGGGGGGAAGGAGEGAP